MSTSRIPRLELAPGLHRSYVLCRRDQALPARRQRDQARSIGAPVIELPTGHDPMVSAPKALPRILDDLPAAWSGDGDR